MLPRIVLTILTVSNYCNPDFLILGNHLKESKYIVDIDVTSLKTGVYEAVLAHSTWREIL